MAEAGIRALRRIEAFAGLPQPVLQHIGERVTWRRFNAGDIIFHEGDPVDRVHLLHSGRVKVTTVSPDGREHLLHLLDPGAVFPRVGFFRGDRYPATARMDAPGIVGILHKESLRQLIREDGDAAAALFAMMEGVVMELQERVRSLALHDVKSRVQQVLLRHAGRQLTHQEIAAFVGAARETVSRAIADLRRQGVKVGPPHPRRRARPPAPGQDERR